MPARTNRFQRLVKLVKQHVAGDGNVVESRMLIDARTGEKREVDLVVETLVAGHRVHVCFECVGRGRSATVEWIEGMRGKHQDLPTSKLVLVSERGFTKAARKKAVALSFELLELETLDEAAVASVLAGHERLYFKVIHQDVERIVVEVASPPDMPGRVVLPRDTDVCDASGNVAGTLGQVADVIAAAPEIRERLLEEMTAEHTWATLGFRLPPHSAFIRHEERGLHAIEAIELHARVKILVAPFTVQRGKLGDNEVAWGEPIVEGLDALVVASQDASGETKVSVDVRTTVSAKPRGRRPRATVMGSSKKAAKAKPAAKKPARAAAKKSGKTKRPA